MVNDDAAMPPGGPSPHAYISGPPGQPPGYSQPNYDLTGQVAPPGMKPRVTATLWEDEGSMCFQVEAKGVCVARRDGTAPLHRVGRLRLDRTGDAGAGAMLKSTAKPMGR